MPKAKKQESGNWRVRVYAETDSNGKKIYKSFTAPTKKEAEFLAAQWQNSRKDYIKNPEKITLHEAVEKYIEMKKNVLSPSTIAGYTRNKRWISEIGLGTVKLHELSQARVQAAFNLFAANHSPKSCRNLHSLVSSALKIYVPDIRLAITLPQKEKTEINVPSNEDISLLLRAIKGKELEKAVMLAAFGSLRRSEICPLLTSDINGNVLTVNKAMVQDENKSWQIKKPKTLTSTRKITLPDFVVSRLVPEKDDKIFTATPDQISNRFKRLVKRFNLPHIRFHDLRHYQASILHAMGIPDKYISERGGWATDNTLKRIYQHTMSDKRQEVEKQICSFFELQNKQTENEDFEKYDAKYDATVNKRGNDAV